MSTFFDEIRFSTGKAFELVDITERVKESVGRSGIRNGMVLVFSQHTTGPVRISEREESLLGDYAAFFEKLAPKGTDYAHNKTNVDDRPNGHSHLQSMVLNASETIPLKDGELGLGKWQTIFFVELDGARPERRVTVEVLGE